MFENILKNYEQEKKQIERENGKLQRPRTNSILTLLDKTKKYLKSLGEPLSREILMNLNSVFDKLST